MVARDDELIPNALPSAQKLDVTTGPDATAPSFVAGYPVLDNIGDESFGITVALNEAGAFYYILLPNASTPTPSGNQIRSGLDGNNQAPLASGSLSVGDANTIVTAAVSSATVANTSYDVYIVAEDDEVPANVQSFVTKLDLTSAADGTPPTFVSGYPKVSSLGDFQFTLEVQLNEPGTVRTVLCVLLFSQ